MSVIAPTPKLSEGQYTLRLVVVPCQYLPSPSPSFQPISTSLSSHISYVAGPYILRRRIHPWCPASPPPCLSADVFIADLVCHPHYPASPLRLRCYPSASLSRSSLHCLPSSRILRCRFLSTFSDRIFSLLCIVLYYTACSSLNRTTFLTLRFDLLTTIFFSLLERLFSLSVVLSLRSDLPRFSTLASTPLCSNLNIPISSVCSYLLAPSLICSFLCSLSNLLDPIFFNQIAQI